MRVGLRERKAKEAAQFWASASCPRLEGRQVEVLRLPREEGRWTFSFNGLHLLEKRLGRHADESTFSRRHPLWWITLSLLSPQLLSPGEMDDIGSVALGGEPFLD